MWCSSKNTLKLRIRKQFAACIYVVDICSIKCTVGNAFVDNYDMISNVHTYVYQRVPDKCEHLRYHPGNNTIAKTDKCLVVSEKTLVTRKVNQHEPLIHINSTCDVQNR